MGSFIENINVDFDIQPKKKKKKDTGKIIQKFDLSSKKENVKKIHLCN